jgi:hypothetical protein
LRIALGFGKVCHPAGISQAISAGAEGAAVALTVGVGAGAGVVDEVVGVGSLGFEQADARRRRVAATCRIGRQSTTLA